MSSPADSPFSYYQDSPPPTPSEFQYESYLATPPEFQYESPLATTLESQYGPASSPLSSPPPPPSPLSSPPQFPLSSPPPPPSPLSSPPPSPSPLSSPPQSPLSSPPPPSRPPNVCNPRLPLGKRCEVSKVILAGVIAGCVIGFILLVLALRIFIIYFRRKRGKRRDVVEIFPREPPHEPKGMSALYYIYVVLNYQSSLHLTRI
ncbi:hypothetical protein L3X38_016354 [Prunus dulcis]|uniref:Uncharacterized protein n=1 Tax=Prunus dulcis TaxID=3755 RepID=A0AAD4W564_PRUDU|nr:hypothetical protein L3X38_016354 [Prunus dulcis]